MFAVFTMKINIHTYILTDTSEQLRQQIIPFLIVAIISIIQYLDDSFCLQCHI